MRLQRLRGKGIRLIFQSRGIKYLRSRFITVAYLQNKDDILPSCARMISKKFLKSSCTRNRCYRVFKERVRLYSIGNSSFQMILMANSQSKLASRKELVQDIENCCKKIIQSKNKLS